MVFSIVKIAAPFSSKGTTFSTPSTKIETFPVALAIVTITIASSPVITSLETSISGAASSLITPSNVKVLFEAKLAPFPSNLINTSPLATHGMLKLPFSSVVTFSLTSPISYETVALPIGLPSISVNVALILKSLLIESTLICVSFLTTVKLTV